MKAPKQENGEFGRSPIERLIDVRLKAHFQEESLPSTSVPHPDDDLISAFIEGRLDEVTSLSMVSHLAHCATCLHLTANLIRFEADMNEVCSASMPEQDPGFLQEYFDRITQRTIPLDEEAVLAYEEKDASTIDDDLERKAESQTES